MSLEWIECDLLATSRRRIYWDWINEGVSHIHATHGRAIEQHSGCFFAPFRMGQCSYVNARWQEVVLPLAWAVRRGIEGVSIDWVWQGINYWASLQRRSGSFRQYSQHDCDFAATAFSTYAIAATFDFLKTSLPEQAEVDKIHNCLYRSGRWLSRNNERVYSNQQIAAALALLEISLVIDEPDFADAAWTKIEATCDDRHSTFFPEKKGFDFGYSSLSLEMLARYFLRTSSHSQKEFIADSAGRYIQFLRDTDLSFISGSGTRQTDWVVTGGFEVFIPHLEDGGDLFTKIFSTLDVRHLPDSRHVHTDLCRLCFAFDNAKIDLDGTVKQIKRAPNEIISTTEAADYRWLRPIGLHRLRGWV